MARLMRDRVENMSGEMKLTPKLTPGAHPASPAQPSPPLPSSSARRKKVCCRLVAELLQPSSLSLYFQPVVFAVIHCSLVSYSLSRVQCYHFLSLCARTPLPTHTDALSQVLFFFFSQLSLLCLSCFLLSAPSPSFQQWRKSWLYWHVSFHHANAGEERGERSGRGECVLRRKGPSQPRAKPCPSSGEPRRCDSVLLKPGQLLVTLAHRCTHPKGEVTHVLCSV